MKISTKGRYALRMLLDLAQHQNDGYVALKDIARRQNVSKKYLEQIVPMLNKSDILLASRGFQGLSLIHISSRKPRYSAGYSWISPISFAEVCAELSFFQVAR